MANIDEYQAILRQLDELDEIKKGVEEFYNTIESVFEGMISFTEEEIKEFTETLLTLDRPSFLENINMAPVQEEFFSNPYESSNHNTCTCNFCTSPVMSYNLIH